MEGDGGRETGRKGAGDRRREGGKRDSQGGGKQEKQGKIMQHCTIFLKGAVSSIFSITVKSQKTHFYLWKPKNNGPVVLKRGVPVHGNYNKYVWRGMARMEMACNLKTSGRIFQVSALCLR